MRVIDASRAVLRFQYRIVRFPLEVIEERVVARMGTEVPARLFYERALGLLDSTAGNALGDYRLGRRGSALAERSAALRRAAQLDADADQARQQSSADLKAKSDKAIEDRQDARAAKKREVDQARTAAEDRQHAADNAAAQRIAAAKKQADDVAALRKNSTETAKRTKQARITADERKAAAAANSKLDDAAARRDEANSKRAQANRIEQLADSEKNKRQSARANNT
ncbi:IF2 family translation initiation factor [Mycobacterium sp. MMS18-G62]